MEAKMSTVVVGKKFEFDVVYNGVTKDLVVEPHQQVTAVVEHAAHLFGITQNVHLLALFRADGTEIAINQSVTDAALLTQAFRAVRECGRARNECVVYWTGPVATPDRVDAQDHPLHRRSPAGYDIDSDWLTKYWFRLARERRAIRLQIHTHPGAAFHSETDDHWPVVSQPGFISIVIPGFGSGPISLEAAWVTRLDANGQWQAVAMEEVLE